jgi:outer membrane protein assembly factor BamB
LLMNSILPLQPPYRMSYFLFKHPAAIPALLLGCLLFLPLPQLRAEWPQWRGPDLNGISLETRWSADWPDEGPRQLWRAEVGIGFSSVAVSQGRLFTLGNSEDQDTIYCLDAQTGQPLWTYAYPSPLAPKFYEGGPGATPTVDGNVVYTLSKQGDLFCFEAGTGRVIWKTNLPETTEATIPTWGFSSSPLPWKNLLILNVGSAGTAVEKRSGKVVWTSGNESAGYATPVPFTHEQETYALIFGFRWLSSVRLKDGREMWRVPWKTRHDTNCADPLIYENSFFVSSHSKDGALMTLGVEPPEVIWEEREIFSHLSPGVISGGHLYIFSGQADRPGGLFKCLDLRSGETRWRRDDLGIGSLKMAGDKLIILSEKGELIVARANPEEYEQLARAQVLGGRCWTVPVLSEGLLYARNAAGELVCLDLRPFNQPNK